MQIIIAKHQCSKGSIYERVKNWKNYKQLSEVKNRNFKNDLAINLSII